MTSHRPTFEDIRDEQRRFIGPPAPPQIPKFTLKAKREEVQRCFWMIWLRGSLQSDTSSIRSTRCQN